MSEPIRINKFIAQSTSLSRRKADDAILDGRVTINKKLATTGSTISSNDTVTLDGKPLIHNPETKTIIIHKPVGYVCSRDGQGSQTVYDLLPENLQHLNYVGRLDKDSSGLLLITNDGNLAEQLTHPRYGKTKRYEVELDKPLEPLHQQIISNHGIKLEDGVSKFAVNKLNQVSGRQYEVIITEGRNRQIRRTFEGLGYTVTGLHRTNFGLYSLGDIKPGQFREID